jgi:hypothetical protein
MKFNKFSLFAALATILALLASGQKIWAMEAGSSSETVGGPELWGVVVVECAAEKTASIRVKKIEDCDVSVHTELGQINNCPTQASDALYLKLTGITLFEDPRTPIITKVKNFHCKDGGAVCSFDAQIKFVEP